MASKCDNPIRELQRDAQTIDRFANSDGNADPRKGDNYPTLRKKLSELESDFKDKQESVLESQLFSKGGKSKGVYGSISDGINDTSKNDWFWVIPNKGDDIDFLTLFKNDGGDEKELYTHYNLNAFMVKEGDDWDTDYRYDGE